MHTSIFYSLNKSVHYICTSKRTTRLIPALSISISFETVLSVTAANHAFPSTKVSVKCKVNTTNIKLISTYVC